MLDVLEQKTILAGQGLLYNVNGLPFMKVSEPGKTEVFAKELRERFESSRFKTHSELANAAKVSKQNLSRILNQTPHSITDKPPGITPVTVKRLANALDWNEREAMLLVGFYENNREDEEFSTVILKSLFPSSVDWSDDKADAIGKALESTVKTLDENIPDNFKK